MSKFPYAYAVLDEDVAEDVRQSPLSVHRTRAAALAAAVRRQRCGERVRAVVWDASPWAREFWPDCELA